MILLYLIYFLFEYAQRYVIILIKPVVNINKLIILLKFKVFNFYAKSSDFSRTHIIKRR